MDKESVRALLDHVREVIIAVGTYDRFSFDPDRESKEDLAASIKASDMIAREFLTKLDIIIENLKKTKG